MTLSAPSQYLVEAERKLHCWDVITRIMLSGGGEWRQVRKVNGPLALEFIAALHIH